MKHLRYRAYIDQKTQWTQHQQVIMAQYNADEVVLYVTGKKKRLRAAITEGTLNAAHDGSGMLWLAVEFAGAAQRSAWGEHPQRGGLLAVWVQRAAFDALLADAVTSRYQPGSYPSEAAWQAAHNASAVRAQWDAIRTPDGGKHRTRRTLFLGLTPERLTTLAPHLTGMQDLSTYIAEQGRFREAEEMLLVPAETLYPVEDAEVAQRLGLDKRAR